MRKISVIDVETLEIFDSISACARKMNVNVSAIYNNILLCYKTKGRRFDFVNDWKYWSNKEKEKHTRKNNIYFL